MLFVGDSGRAVEFLSRKAILLGQSLPELSGSGGHCAGRILIPFLVRGGEIGRDARVVSID